MTMEQKCDLCGAKSSVKKFTSSLSLGEVPLADLCVTCANQVKASIQQGITQQIETGRIKDQEIAQGLAYIAEQKAAEQQPPAPEAPPAQPPAQPPQAPPQ